MGNKPKPVSPLQGRTPEQVGFYTLDGVDIVPESRLNRPGPIRGASRRSLRRQAAAINRRNRRRR